MLYEQCIWRLKCFLSIQVKKYLVYLFLASWEWFLQTSALQSASTEERLSGDFLLIKSCVYEFFGVDKKWPYETKNRYIGYFMNKIDRKHIVLQVKTKNVIRFPPLEKLLSLKVMKPSKTAVKTADRSYHFKRHCTYCRFLKKIKYSSILLTLHSIHSQVFLLPTLSTIYCTLHPHCLKDNFRTFWMQISFGILQVFLFPVCTANFEGYLYCVPFIDNFPWC